MYNTQKAAFNCQLIWKFENNTNEKPIIESEIGVGFSFSFQFEWKT